MPALLSLALSSSPQAAPPGSPGELSLIPRPVSVIRTAGSFSLNQKVTIGTDAGSRPAAALLSGWLQAATGRAPKASSRGSITLKVNPALTGLGTEGYRLEVTPTNVSLSAPKYAGIVNGLQTFRQLWPTGKAASFSIPTVKIEDQPRFPWRGMMLDVSRYFLDKNYVLHYLDVMAAHKLNTLHLHLIDDAGWRLEM
ncbi:MAG: family 20 glycosylhydrolase [Armatimonas sp.]